MLLIACHFLWFPGALQSRAFRRETSLSYAFLRHHEDYEVACAWKQAAAMVAERVCVSLLLLFALRSRKERRITGESHLARMTELSSTAVIIALLEPLLHLPQHTFTLTDPNRYHAGYYRQRSCGSCIR